MLVENLIWCFYIYINSKQKNGHELLRANVQGHVKLIKLKFFKVIKHLIMTDSVSRNISEDFIIGKGASFRLSLLSYKQISKIILSVLEEFTWVGILSRFVVRVFLDKLLKSYQITFPLHINGYSMEDLPMLLRGETTLTLVLLLFDRWTRRPPLHK
jgi:hypothetical protein